MHQMPGPNRLVVEFIDDRARHNEIRSLILDDHKVSYANLERMLNGGKLPFHSDELHLFTLGWDLVSTKCGLYERKGLSTVRLDDLGMRGGYYPLVTVEYHVKTKG